MTLSLPIRLAGDASNYGVVAVLSQILPDGSEHPIAFAPRTMQPREQNYTQVEKEALSLVIQKFHEYLSIHQFTLVTDHKPPTTILGPKTEVPAQALLLPAYTYNIDIRPTKSHANADGLCLLPLSLLTVVDPVPSVPARSETILAASLGTDCGSRLCACSREAESTSSEEVARRSLRNSPNESSNEDLYVVARTRQ